MNKNKEMNLNDDIKPKKKKIPYWQKKKFGC